MTLGAYGEALLRGALSKAIPETRDEELALAVWEASRSRVQSDVAKAGRGEATRRATRRINHVDIILRYLLDRKYRSHPKSARTIQRIRELLHEIGIEARESTIRRDVNKALLRGPL